jgi:triphosphoribosyl-dephospho-CoA synthetase
MVGVSGEPKIKRASIMFYTAWNIWKERYKRVFETKTGTHRRVLHLIREELAKRAAACWGSRGSRCSLMLLSLESLEFILL